MSSLAMEELAYVCQLTNATKGEKDGKQGFFVSGKLRNYFVHEATADVYDADTGKYFSVVGRNGKHGDNTILSSLLLALHNDMFLTSKIPTLELK